MIKQIIHKYIYYIVYLNNRHFFLVLEYQGLAEKKVRLVVVKDIEKAE